MTSSNLNSITWYWKAWSELTVDEVTAMFKLRQDVFIVEQDCPFHDIDGKDDQALHLFGWDGDILVATLRLFENYKPYQNQASIGRICSHKDYRSTGAGRELVRRGVEYIDQHLPNQSTQIGAQQYLQRFYESFGFVQCSEPYDEDGIQHILMQRKAHCAA